MLRCFIVFIARALTCARSVWLALALCVMALPAAAVTVTVDGTTYDLSVSVTDYPTDAILLESQQWWGNSGVAQSIADAYLSSGDVDLTRDFGGDRVIFAYSVTYAPGITTVSGVTLEYDYDDDKAVSKLRQFGGTEDFNYVVVTPASSVPEINAGALSQVFLILFALWLVVRRREASTAV